MAKNPSRKTSIPAPKRTNDDCRSWDGITLCGHVVHLTAKQMKLVRAMHRENLEHVVQAAAKKVKSKKKAAAKKITKREARKSKSG